MKNILITGSTSFIGEELTTYLLKKKYNIHCITRSKQKKKPQKDLI